MEAASDGAGRAADGDARRFAPATQRNRDAILDVLRRILPMHGLVLEIASGTGEHVHHFAAALPGLDFQPSDLDAAARASIDAWASSTGLERVRPALALDATDADWPLHAADAVLCVNMIHIAPWPATPGLFAGASRVLPRGAPLVVYGPFRERGKTKAGNMAFDAELRARDPRWGVRDLEAVIEVGWRAGFASPEIVRMPANNLCLVFLRC